MVRRITQTIPMSRIAVHQAFHRLPIQVDGWADENVCFIRVDGCIQGPVIAARFCMPYTDRHRDSDIWQLPKTIPGE